MIKEDAAEPAVTYIKPKSGWQLLDLKELKEYRDLFYFMVWREIKILYAQTVLGFSWAILQPLVQIIIFTVIFGKVARVSSDGIPYFLFSSVAIVPWTYMSQAMTQSSNSLVQHANMLGKIYFPRLIYPITPILARLVDFGISMVIIFFCGFLLQGYADLEPASVSGSYIANDGRCCRNRYVAFCDGNPLS